MTFAYRQSGTCGHEILDCDGSVIAWTVDVEWAGIIVGCLNKAAPFHITADYEAMTKDEVKNLVQTLLKHRSKDNRSLDLGGRGPVEVTSTTNIFRITLMKYGKAISAVPRPNK